MDSWRQSLTACWHSVAMTLPEGLQESLSHLGQSLGQSLGLGGLNGDVGGGTAAGQVYELHGRRLRVIRQLGEGGYSFVYLVQPLRPDSVHSSSAGGGPLAVAAAAPAAGQLFALKRVLCGSEQQLREAEHEVAVMRRLRHPCLLALEAASTQLQRAPDGSSRHVVLMLFPVYDGGNLFDFVQQLRSAREQAARGQPAAARREARLAELATLLRIFLQVCAALHAMHSGELAHRDVKPQNVLLRKRQQQQQQRQQQDKQQQQQQHDQQHQHPGGGRATERAYDPVPPLPLAAPQEDQSLQRQEQQVEQQAEQWADGKQGWAAGSWQSSSDAAGSGTAAAAAAAYAAAGAPAELAAEHEGQRQRRQEEAWWAGRLEPWRREHEAVLMDFGSARLAVVEVRNRMEAMAAQEDAERQCTAPYRAPELWDVASSCTLDERVDVWSLGCLLYYCLCGQSPFERAASEAGGSLMLAVVNGRLSWPADAADLPESVKALVGRCLDTDPSTRPRVAEVARAADRILASLLL
ncbi:hypothetical protein ABPG75_007206 [Micractinium tetrahymenae]